MFNTEELEQFAKDTLKNAATGVEKAAAKKAIRRLDALKENKADIESCGKKPTRKHFTNDADYRAALTAYWDALDRRAVRKQAEQILNDRDSSPLSRHNARKRIEALDGPSPSEIEVDEKKPSTNTSPTREDFGFQSGFDWTEFVASGGEERFQAALAKWRETAPPPDPKIAAFLNALDEESVNVTRPAPQSVAHTTPIAPTVDPRFYCEECRVPFKVCGCDRVMCSLCLRPQSDCFPPCQNARRRF